MLIPIVNYAGWKRLQDPAAGMISALSLPLTDRDVTLQYVDASHRYVWTPSFGPYWARWTVGLASSGFWYTYGLAIYHVLHGFAASDANLSAVSSAWSTTASAASFGGAYRAKGFVTGWAEFHVTGARTLYLMTSQFTTGGFLAVTINGGTGLVNELPDTSGERRISCYAPSASQGSNRRWKVASGLDPATTYTVRVTISAQAGAEGGTIAFFEGWGYDAESMNDGVVGTVSNDQKLERTLVDLRSSYWEYAQWLRPAGALNFEIGGTGHLNESITSVTWEDADGNDVSVDATTTKRNAPSITLTNGGTSRHSETGTLDLANVLCESTWNNAGLDIHHRHDWLTDVEGGLAYACMFTQGAPAMTRGQVAGDRGAAYDLTVGGDVWHGGLASRAGAFWNPASPWVSFLHMPDLVGVNNWVNSASKFSFDDRSQVGVALVKAYVFRNDGHGQDVAYEHLHAGDVWENTAHYRVGYIDPPSRVLPL